MGCRKIVLQYNYCIAAWYQMVVDHWFMQIEKVLEVIEITSDTTRIRLAAFQLESEAQIWWKWARTSRDHREAIVFEFSLRD